MPSHMISFIGRNSSNYMKTGKANNGRTKEEITEDKSRGGSNGLFQAVENYHLTMQREDDGDIPTFEDAHSEMSRKGLLNQVEDTRIAMQEQVSAKVSSETALSVHQAICGAGNRGKPRGKLTYRPSSILMIEQFGNKSFVTPLSGSPDNPNRVYSERNEDIAYELFNGGWLHQQHLH